MSRGASELISVERSRPAAGVLERNIRSCGLENSAEVMVCGAAEALGRLHAAGRLFDAVFMDPPYGDHSAAAVLKTIGSSSLMSDGAFLVFESSTREAGPETVGRLLRVREDAYGDTKLTLYENREEREEQ